MGGGVGGRVQLLLSLSEIPGGPTYVIQGAGASNFFPRGWSPIANR